jgi:L-alanine-DL-glutamate epimerase-like enolase superfamily enzyme
MRLAQFRLTRFQFARDRVIGDSQVRADDVNCAALELVDDAGRVGLGFLQSLFTPLPDLTEITRIFATEVWPGLDGLSPQALIHRVTRPRGGNQRALGLPFGEALQVALWDLAAKQLDLPLHVMLGSRRDRVRAYASGLDFHLSDDDFQALFAHAVQEGYRAFKIKTGHPDFARDLHRLELLTRVIPKGSQVMIDSNEAWAPQETAVKLAALQKIHPILWAEDPILRHDFEGLKLLRQIAGCQINSGEYLDVQGKRLLLQAGGADLLNVHGQVTDVMRIGWLAADMGVPVTLGKTLSLRSAFIWQPPSRKWSGWNIRSRTSTIWWTSPSSSRTASPTPPTGPATGWCCRNPRAPAGPGRSFWRVVRWAMRPRTQDCHVDPSARPHRCDRAGPHETCLNAAVFRPASTGRFWRGRSPSEAGNPATRTPAQDLRQSDQALRHHHRQGRGARLCP